MRRVTQPNIEIIKKAQIDIQAVAKIQYPIKSQNSIRKRWSNGSPALKNYFPPQKLGKLGRANGEMGKFFLRIYLNPSRLAGIVYIR